MEDKDLLVYEDDEAVKYILEILPEEYKNVITDEKIEYILDLVYEYYENKGLIQEDSTEEASIDEDEMFDFILGAIEKDKMKIGEDEIDLILNGEFEYGKSIGVYSEE